MKTTVRTDDSPTVRYMVDGGQGGSMFRGLTGLVAIVIVVAVLLGLAVGNPLTGLSNLFDRDRQTAETAKIQAEADVMIMEAETAKDRSELDLKLTEERAKSELQAEIERQRLQTESDIRRRETVTEGVGFLLLAGAVGIFGVLFATAIYIVCKAAALPPHRPTRNAVKNGRVLTFPGRPERGKTSTRKREKEDSGND